MMKPVASACFGVSFALLSVACSDTAGPRSSGGTGDADGGTEGAMFDAGTELRVTVPEAGRVYVKLNPPSVVAVGDPNASLGWDLAFECFDVFTNSGVSGRGQGASFGPLDALTFIGDEAPQVPFLSPDKTRGAFLDWYKYEGAPSHALWSRYHIFGVREGVRLWKVQILTYYGQRDGASVPGLYTIRYAEVTGGTTGLTRDNVGLDATAGGAQAGAETPSECIDLGSGARTMLTPEAARTSSAWHLCFRRQTITVNGELGGPRGVGAVDLEADKMALETTDELKAMTAETERARFDAVTAASFEGKVFRGDRVISGLGDAWINAKASPIEPAYAAWLVVAANGEEKFLVGFASFENPMAKSPGTVVMRVKPVKG